QRVDECVRVANLAVEDDSRLERRPCQLEQLVSAVALLDHGRGQLRRTDLEPDDLATRATPTAALLALPARRSCLLAEGELALVERNLLGCRNRLGHRRGRRRR